jgi:phosphoglycolate phosphatase
MGRQDRSAMATYKLVIFDFDGTLADSYPWFRRVLNHVAKKFRFKPVEWDSEAELLRGKSAREILDYLGVSYWKVPFISRHMRSLMTRDIEEIHLFDGTNHMLRRLSDIHIALAIVSSNSKSNVRRVLGPETASLIDYYACGAAIFGKSAKIGTVLRKSNVSVDDVIYVGDEIRDLEAARHAGLAFGAVAWGYTRPEALAALSPTLMFTRLDQITSELAPAREAKLCGGN